jgi:signal transduction histidine kinase
VIRPAGGPAPQAGRRGGPARRPRPARDSGPAGRIVLLNEICRAIAAEDDPSRLLPKVARILRRRLGCLGVVIGLAPARSRRLEVAAAAGEGGRRAPAGDAPLMSRRLVRWRGAGSVLTLRMPVRGVVGVIRVESARPLAFDRSDRTMLLAAAEQVGHAVRRGRAMAALRLRQRDVEMVSHRLERMLEEERRRIARELHDELAQSMTAAKINLALIRQQMPHAAAGAKRAIRDTEGIVRRTIAAIRRIAMDLRPAVLDDLGLLPALDWLADLFSRRTGIAVTIAARGAPASGDAEIRTLLYRFVQEALTNVARHARARSVRVDLSAVNGRIRAVIDDDGRGMRGAPGGRPSGFGLIGMRERIERVGGTLSIESRAGRGTRLVAEVPRTERAASRQGVAARWRPASAAAPEAQA